MQRRVVDLKAMVLFVARAQGTQDGKCLFLVGFSHLHALKAPLERRVLLDIAPVLRERRRADDADLSAPERGLQDVRRVHRSLGAARADDGVQLVDEQNDVSLAPHLVEQSADALFKFAAVLRSRHHARKVERQNALVKERIGYVSLADPLGKALHDRRLANARLADEHGVVLRAAREDADGARDLLLSPDDGVEASLARHRR